MESASMATTTKKVAPLTAVQAANYRYDEGRGRISDQTIRIWRKRGWLAAIEVDLDSQPRFDPDEVLAAERGRMSPRPDVDPGYVARHAHLYGATPAEVEVDDEQDDTPSDPDHGG